MRAWVLVLAACGRVDFAAGGDARHTGIRAVSSVAANSLASVTVIATTPRSFAAGDLLVACVHVDDSSLDATSVTDSAGNTFLLATGSLLQVIGEGVQTVEIWFAPGIAASPDDVVSANLSGSSPATIIVRDYAGADPVQPFEVGQTGTTITTTSVSSGVFAPAAAGNLDVAFGVPQNTGTIVVGTGAWTAGAGYSLAVHEPMRDMELEEQLAGPAGPQTAALAYSQPGNLIISVASFRPVP